MKNLTRVLENLARLRDADDPPSRPGVSPLRWKDDKYLYLEARLPDTAKGSVDIAIHGRRVFIRVAR